MAYFAIPWCECVCLDCSTNNALVISQSIRFTSRSDSPATQNAAVGWWNLLLRVEHLWERVLILPWDRITLRKLLDLFFFFFLHGRYYWILINKIDICFLAFISFLTSRIIIARCMRLRAHSAFAKDHFILNLRGSLLFTTFISGAMRWLTLKHVVCFFNQLTIETWTRTYHLGNPHMLTFATTKTTLL